MINLKTKITQIHYQRDPEGIIFDILKFASYFYAFGSGFKNFLYDKKILRPKKVKAFVISVGNMTTGGVGKTPVVSEIAKYLINQGEKVAIVSRGYGGRLNNKNVNMISDGTTIFMMRFNLEMNRTGWQKTLRGAMFSPVKSLSSS